MNAKKWAIPAVMGGNAIFGFSFLFSRLALDYTTPIVLIAVRFTVAFLIMNLIVLAGCHIKKKNGEALLKFSLRNKPLKDILLLAIFQPIIYFAAENYGILYTSSAFAGIIIAVIPIMGIVLDVILMHTSVSKKQIICALASVLGVAITTYGASNMTSSLKGTLFLMVAVLAGSLFYVFSKKSGENYSPIERTYVMFGLGSISYIIMALVTCAGNYKSLILIPLKEPVFWVSILYLSCVSSVIAFLLLNMGSSYVSISSATIFANLTTVISIVAGVAILHEDFSVYQGIGAAIILLSVYISSVNNK